MFMIELCLQNVLRAPFIVSANNVFSSIGWSWILTPRRRQMRPTLLYQTLYAESKTCLSWTVEFTMKPLEMYFGVGESLFDKLMLLKEKKRLSECQFTLPHLQHSHNIYERSRYCTAEHPGPYLVKAGLCAGRWGGKYTLQFQIINSQAQISLLDSENVQVAIISWLKLF